MTTEWLHDNVIIRSLMPTPGQIDQERLSGAWVTPDTPITATHDRVIVSARDRVTHVLTGAWEDPSHRWDIEDTEALRESGPDTVVGLYRDTLPYTCYDDALMEKYWMDPSSLDVFEHDRLFAGSVSPVTMQLADVNKHIEHELGAYWGVDVNDPARKNPVDVRASAWTSNIEALQRQDFYRNVNRRFSTPADLASADSLPDLWETLRTTRDPALAATLGVNGTTPEANRLRGQLARDLTTYENEQLHMAEETARPEPDLATIPMLHAVMEADGDLSQLDPAAVSDGLRTALGLRPTYGYAPWLSGEDGPGDYDPLDYQPYKERFDELTMDFPGQAIAQADDLAAAQARLTGIDMDRETLAVADPWERPGAFTYPQVRDEAYMFIEDAATIPELWETLTHIDDPRVAATLGVKGTSPEANAIRGDAADALYAYETQQMRTRQDNISLYAHPEYPGPSVPMLSTVVAAHGDPALIDLTWMNADLHVAGILDPTQQADATDLTGFQDGMAAASERFHDSAIAVRQFGDTPDLQETPDESEAGQPEEDIEWMGPGVGEISGYDMGPCL